MPIRKIAFLGCWESWGVTGLFPLQYQYSAFWQATITDLRLLSKLSAKKEWVKKKKKRLVKEAKNQTKQDISFRVIFQLGQFWSKSIGKSRWDIRSRSSYSNDGRITLHRLTREEEHDEEGGTGCWEWSVGSPVLVICPAGPAILQPADVYQAKLWKGMQGRWTPRQRCVAIQLSPTEWL